MTTPTMNYKALLAARAALETARSIAAASSSQAAVAIQRRDAARVEMACATDALTRELRECGVPEHLVSIDYALRVTDAYMEGRESKAEEGEVTA